MASQAAVHNPSPERPDSSQSIHVNGNEPNYPETFTNHADLHFAPARPPRASRRSFEDHLATLQNLSEQGPSIPTEPSHGTSQSSQPASTLGAIDERSMGRGQLPDSHNPGSNRSVPDPFPDQTSSSAPPAQPTSPTSIYQDEGPLHAPVSQPQSMSTQRNTTALQSTPPTTPLTSALLPSTQSPSLPAPIRAFNDQRATQVASSPTTRQASASAPPNAVASSNPQTIQPTTSSNSHTHNHHPASPRDRRRRRFARWVRRRFRRQLPWLEGWLHGREGSERREARRAIRAAEEAGFR